MFVLSSYINILNQMAKVITLSQVYPKHHIDAGKPTYFVEKVLASLADTIPGFQMLPHFKDYDWHKYYNCSTPKHTTIRLGRSRKTGDKVSLRVWGNDINPKSGRSGPYHSKQIVIAPDVEIQVTEILIYRYTSDYIEVWTDLDDIFKDKNLNLEEVATNDGLTVESLTSWFSNLMPGYHEAQIIRWGGVR